MRIISKSDAEKGTLQVQIHESADVPKAFKSQPVTVVGSTGGKGGGTYTVKSATGRKLNGVRACDMAAVKPLIETLTDKTDSTKGSFQAVNPGLPRTPNARA